MACADQRTTARSNRQLWHRHRLYDFTSRSDWSGSTDGATVVVNGAFGMPITEATYPEIITALKVSVYPDQGL